MKTCSPAAARLLSCRKPSKRMAWLPADVRSLLLHNLHMSVPSCCTTCPQADAFAASCGKGEQLKEALLVLDKENKVGRGPDRNNATSLLPPPCVASLGVRHAPGTACFWFQPTHHPLQLCWCRAPWRLMHYTVLTTHRTRTFWSGWRHWMQRARSGSEAAGRTATCRVQPWP